MNLSKIADIGTAYDNPYYVVNKIRLTNNIAIVYSVFAAMPFAVLTYYHIPSLTLLPVVGAIAQVMGIFFNAVNQNVVGRFISAITPIILATLYGALLSSYDEPLILNFQILQFSFAFLPFIIFDLREPELFYFTMAISIVLLLSTGWLNPMLEVDVNNTIFKTGYLGKISLLMAFITGYGCVAMVGILGLIASKKADGLLSEAKEQMRQIEVNEQRSKENIKRIKEAGAKEQAQNWAAEGYNILTRILRNNLDLKEACKKVLNFLVEYIDVTQGGIYLVVEGSNGEVTLELLTSYAYSRKKLEETTISVGEGPIGQAYQEGNTIYLKEIPCEYLRITSGLGGEVPREVIVIPIKNDDGIEGVLELGSFKNIQPYKVEFLKNACESIASSLRSAKSNEKTKALLLVAQDQAQQMTAQEEEMRQNTEELSAIQEELFRQKEELEKEVEALRNSL